MNFLARIFGLTSIASLTTAFAGQLPPIDPANYKLPIRVACIGDSITAGGGAGKGKSYPSQLQDLLGDSWKVENYGVSARTLLNKGDFPYTKEKAYRKSLKFQPHIVIIMLGTNDTKPQNWQHQAEFTADYTKLVKSFLALESKPKVYLCRPSPIIGDGNYDITEKNLLEAIKQIDALAAELGLGVIDMHAALAGKPEFLPDRVHPNTQGAAAMAKAAFTVLTGKP
jgi:lysophospholipase L1-like esterase